MRFAATAVLWLATTVALAIAVPAAWAQLHAVDAGGYTALAQAAAHDPDLQAAMAGELTTRAMALAAAHGGSRYSANSAQLHAAAGAFTAGPAFPPLFAQANRAAHGWLFDDPRSGQDGTQWAVDLAPMLNDSSIRQLLSNYNVQIPATLTVPVAESIPHSLRQGQLKPLTDWGPVISIGAAALTGFCALLTVAAARRRGQALSALGISALLVGAAGWAAIEVAGRYLNGALNRTTGDVRDIAEAMIRHAEAGMHQWLNLTLIGGAALVAFGIVVAILGGLAEPKTTISRR
jgi:hypothetical protein